FAGKTAQSSGAALYRVDNLLDVCDARVIRPAEPEGIDRRIRNHRPNGFVRSSLSDVELSGKSRRRCGVFFIGTPDATHIYLADRSQRLDVKPGVEATADEP